MQVTINDIAGFDEIIDARTPAEFAADHIPGAVNLPALFDRERGEVGALFAASPFAAKRQGAALIAVNIARHLQTALGGRGENWRPLIYCARGGQRSGALAEVLRRVGWPAAQLEGGYKSYRRWVGEEIQNRAPRLRLTMLCGRTGVGKTRLLHRLANGGAQTLDLEMLANHRGSVFGERPGGQPSQRRFESLLCFRLRELRLDAPIFAEAESRKIGALHLPAPLLNTMRGAPAVEVCAAIEQRVAHIISEYRAFCADADLFERTLDKIARFAGGGRIARWQADYRGGDQTETVRGLLAAFYDLGYEKSLAKNYPHIAGKVTINPLDEKSLDNATAALTAAAANAADAALAAQS